MGTGKTTLRFESSDVQIPLSTEEHINKLPFTATFMIIGTPSDGTPCGAEMPIILDMDAAKASVDTMNLMGIDCVWSDWFPEDCMTGHDPRNIIGVVQSAYIEGNEMKMQGIIYSNNFPDIAFFIKNATPSLGFSMECIADIEARDDGYEHMSNVMFTGVAILFKNLAAYESTYIEYLAAAKKKKEDEKLTKEEMEQLMTSVKETVEASQQQFVDKFKDIEDQLGGLKANAKSTQDDESKAALEKVEAEKKALEDAKAELEAAKVEAEKKAAEDKAVLEKKIADLEAQRKSKGFYSAAKVGFGGDNDADFKEVWSKGYKKGFPLAFSKLKEQVKEGKN